MSTRSVWRTRLEKRGPMATYSSRLEGRGRQRSRAAPHRGRSNDADNRTVLHLGRLDSADSRTKSYVFLNALREALNMHSDRILFRGLDSLSTLAADRPTKTEAAQRRRLWALGPACGDTTARQVRGSPLDVVQHHDAQGGLDGVVEHLRRTPAGQTLVSVTARPTSATATRTCCWQSL